jgi:hypothetical protein
MEVDQQRDLRRGPVWGPRRRDGDRLVLDTQRLGAVGRHGQRHELSVFVDQLDDDTYLPIRSIPWNLDNHGQCSVWRESCRQELCLVPPSAEEVDLSGRVLGACVRQEY